MRTSHAALDDRTWCWKAIDALPLMDIGPKLDMMSTTSVHARLRLLQHHVRALLEATAKPPPATLDAERREAGAGGGNDDVGEID